MNEAQLVLLAAIPLLIEIELCLYDGFNKHRNSLIAWILVMLLAAAAGTLTKGW